MVTAIPRSRRARLAVGAALVALALLLWWALRGEGRPSPGGEVTFATGVRGGVYELYGKKLQQRMADELPDVEVRLVNSHGSPDNIERLVSGRADFAVAAADAVAAYVTEHPEAGSRLRACARLYDDYMQLVVRAGSGIREPADLRGKRVALGQANSGVKLIADRLLKAADIDPRKDIEPHLIGIDTMPKKLADGEIDAFFWSGGLPTDKVSKLSEEIPIRLVPLGDLVSGLQSQRDTADYRSAVIPADAYRNVAEAAEVSSVAVPNLLLTTDRTDENLTEGVTRTVIENRDSIGREVHAAQLVDLRTAIYTDPLELHKGAERYYRSVKP
ncbi:TAXI family TRAP transporter solute-binding subunit [Streptomyces sp. GC420]|uniref:TAXI family TRAP transporter solute-binding subunit n=1 Tax=Streptomyces sp. GC420 TaxID=2697568 RepID=UPI001414E291|nr:TAXI family TRAP transporter solute-binding subunit [Streptomyces sp. GC420]NBM14123.1 TAXI family TRAP transporter solute-binding subunit [Streptomyces sp. GC420]